MRSFVFTTSEWLEVSSRYREQKETALKLIFVAIVLRGYKSYALKLPGATRMFLTSFPLLFLIAPLSDPDAEVQQRNKARHSRCTAYRTPGLARTETLLLVTVSASTPATPCAGFFRLSFPFLSTWARGADQPERLEREGRISLDGTEELDSSGQCRVPGNAPRRVCKETTPPLPAAAHVPAARVRATLAQHKQASAYGSRG
ncbi:hypothetical protein NDU88_001689 [Pleurodeles waltl]|uniref:Uncharacterized protein n=1 Tax=Pleurodeles waltl TaxID=8319 RepID=A0AAV7UTH8_PLEWA|nr:hypothetical protein NDU88_001689 [Pleurodeles waltl]